MSLWIVNTYDYGTHFVWAKSAVAAKNRIVYRIFGKGYSGWEHDYWDVTKKEKN